MRTELRAHVRCSREESLATLLQDWQRPKLGGHSSSNDISTVSMRYIRHDVRGEARYGIKVRALGEKAAKTMYSKSMAIPHVLQIMIACIIELGDIFSQPQPAD